MFELEVLNAKHGDALILRWGTAAKPRLAIIDGGPKGVFKEVLRSRLDTLRDGKPLAVRLAMVSHIDDDHIAGVVDLLRWLRNERAGGAEDPVDITELWHNSFQAGMKALGVPAASVPAAVTLAGLEGGTLPADVRGRLSPEAGAVVASVKQGDEVRRLASGLGIILNEGFAGLVMAAGKGRGGGRPRKVRIDGLDLTVVAPSEARLAALQKEWAKKTKARRASPAELAAYLDESIPNLSSIVVLAEYGKKRMLLTGDARGDDILEGLEEAGLLAPGKTMKVDVLKLPHHGSDRNADSDLFERVLADHYVISADGKHGNPDPDTLRMLTAARENAAYTIWMTNAVPGPKKVLDADRRKAGRKYVVQVREDGEGHLTVRP
jgi:hypothetical protein